MYHEYQVNELEQQLKEAGQQLSSPPSSTKHLLDLLDNIEQLLTCVGQSPSITMQGALVPSMGALIDDELIKHSDMNVRVSVASCLSEIARITAPEPPYKDEIMKEIFQLNVMAFGELSNMSGHSYSKAVHILESAAKVKSFLLMLDLECDALVLAMFEQFLSKTRSTHTHRVYSDMETIMTLVIKESDEISTELLSLLILHVREESLYVSPFSWKLTEKVLRNCVDTLKPYSETIMKLIKSDVDGYAEVVSLLCQNANGNEHVVTKSTKRELSSLENGGSTKKQKYIDKDRLKGKELESPKRGRLKNKKDNSNQDNSPTVVRSSHEDTRSTRLQDKSKEPMQQMNDKVQNRRNSSSKKRVANGSGGKETPKKWKQDLVGHSIKVWWPLDKMYYKGVVSSYDRITDRYKVLYADGDEELLDLNHEKWRILDETSPGQRHEQVTDLQSPMTTSAKLLKPKRKTKLGSLLIQEDKTVSPKSSVPADPSKTEPTKEHEMEVAKTLTANVSCSVDNLKNDPVETPDVESTENLIELEKDGNPNPSVALQDIDLDHLKNDLVQPPAVSCEHESEKSIDKVEQDGETNPSAEVEETYVSNDVDNLKDDPVLKPDISCEPKSTEKPIDKVGQDDESNPSEELEEKRPTESS